jgi:IclR family acetate operon transcriptional repressor
MDRPTEQDTNPQRESGRSVIDSVMAVLAAFDHAHRRLGVREISRRSGVARSTAHRIVTRLLEHGALERGDDGRIQVGVRMFEIGTLAPTHTTIRDAAAPYAHHLSEFTQLTVNVATREGAEVVYLEKIASRETVQDTRLGGRADLHATGLGKAILAFSSPTFIDAVVAGPLPAMTRNTITDPQRLRAELEAIRSRRVAFDLEEFRPGMFCVASPILDSNGAPIAAISVTDATRRTQAELHAGAVRTAALAIGRALG